MNRKNSQDIQNPTDPPLIGFDVQLMKFIKVKKNEIRSKKGDKW